MAISRLVQLFALSSLALIICSSNVQQVAALAKADNHVQIARHMARGHDAIAKRKRSNNSKRCQNRPASSITSGSSSAAWTSSAPTSTWTSSASTSTWTSSSSTPDKQVAAATTSSPPPAKTSSTPASSPPSGGGAKQALGWANGDQWLSNWNVNGVKVLYTWSPACPDSAKSLGMDCYPMLWGWNQVEQFQQLVVPGYANVAMGMNEPNEPGQSNMDPASGAQLWQQYLEPLKSQGYKLVSPVTSSNPNGFTWVQDWFKACNGGCNPDVIALHWYDTTAQKFIDYVTQWHNEWPDLEIWVTEFACQNFNDGPQCSQSEIYSFMSEVTAWMQSQSYIGHYMPFGVMQDLQGVNPDDSLMNPDGTPNALGWIFLNS